MKKVKGIRIKKSKGLEVFEYENTLKLRIPIAPPGFAHKTIKDKKRTKRAKITLDNWDCM